MSQTVGAEAQKSALQPIKFADLYNAERLPSGYSFSMMPDTIETALQVSSIDKPSMATEKAFHAAVVLKTVGSHNLHADDMTTEQAASFVHGMLDTDVLFVSMAWAAQLEGLELKLNEGAACPSCSVHKFMSVPYGDLIVHARPEPISGPSAFYHVEFDDADRKTLPDNLRNLHFSVTDPTWLAARKDVPKKLWTTPEFVELQRVFASTRVSSTRDGAPRMLSRQGEYLALKARHGGLLNKAIRATVPHFEPTLDLQCPNCGEVMKIPFVLER